MSGKMQSKIDRYEFLLDFIAHEIRNPLNSIIMFSNLLAEGAYGDLTAKQADILGRILSSAHRIEHMSGDFLNLRRVDGGEGMLQREWLDLGADIVEAAIRDLGTKFPAYAARLANVTREGCEPPAMVFADRQLMLTVYDNLLFNALKYGRTNGGVRWGCRPKGRFWEMSVTNDGQGVRPEALPSIFRKFYRVKDLRLPRQPGTGLGLYNVQRIVRLHGGSVSASSRYGRDFTIRFTLPRPEAGPGEPEPPTGRVKRGDGGRRG